MTGTSNKDNWSVDSWRSKAIKQQPTYPDSNILNEVLDTLKEYPPLVFTGEVYNLKKDLAKAGRGEAFILQGGDCAEKFSDCNERSITSKLKILLQMSVILTYGLRKPIVRIGRIAGQYAKPRSSNTETINGVELPIFRGDSINGFAATLEDRTPNPERLREAYHYASMTLNYIRALTKGGFADLHQPEHWDIDFVDKAQEKERYSDIIANIHDAITFMESISGVRQENLSSIDFYTSHEGLLLGFEEAMTRKSDRHHLNLGAHMLWIGDRTRDIDGAHIEYFRGIDNPIGIKCGPSSDPQEIARTINVLNPHREEGKIVLITRYGESLIDKHLPPLIDAVKGAGSPVVWSCDPMHGNVIKTDQNIKTRNFNAILSELKNTAKIHQDKKTILGGVHFELTGDNVTECIGGSENVQASDLIRNYETYCDPRLNYTQSLEMAFLLSSMDL